MVYSNNNYCYHYELIWKIKSLLDFKSFVIDFKQSFSLLQTILVEFQPLEKDAVKCRFVVSSVAVIAFYTGDEFMRRQYKK